MNINQTNLTWHGALTYNNSPDTIILHHAEASKCTVQDIHAWHLQNGWCGIGYHYFVRKDGSIYRGRPENAQGAHCPGYNTKSIGICAEGEYMKETMPEVQKQAIIALSKDIKSRYKINNVYGHGEVYSTSCPGTNYPLAGIKQAVINAPKTTVTATSNAGDTNVLALQKALNRLKIRDAKGNVLTEDGILGTCTKEATKRLQSICGLEVDGIAGQYTWNAINAIIAKPLLKVGVNGLVTRYLQFRVSTTQDGVFGNGTATAVQGWQKSNGLVADSIVGSNTWTRLIG